VQRLWCRRLRQRRRAAALPRRRSAARGVRALDDPPWRKSLVDLRLLRVPSVRTATTALTFAGGVLFAGNFLLPLFFQSLRGYSPLDAALLLIPQGVGTLLVRLVVGRLTDRFGARTVAVAGALVMAAATVPFALA